MHYCTTLFSAYGPVATVNGSKEVGEGRLSQVHRRSYLATRPSYLGCVEDGCVEYRSAAGEIFIFYLVRVGPIRLGEEKLGGNSCVLT